MPNPFGLPGYQMLARLRSGSVPRGPMHRNGKELVWAHATTQTRLAALCDLGARLKLLRDDVRVLITVDQTRIDSAGLAACEGCDHIVALSGDHTAEAEQMLETYAPDLCLWAGGALMPNVIAAATHRQMPMVLLDVGESDLPTRRRKWFVDLTRTTLSGFDAVMVTSAPTAAAMRRFGVPAERISVTGRLRPAAAPQPCAEPLLVDVTQKLASRAVWLAAPVMRQEFGAVIEAHRIALRLLHRLLLVIVPADPGDTPALSDALASAGLRFACWSEGDMIEDNTQVLVSDDLEHLGLWYRVAPLVFLAGSLCVQPKAISPLEAAALGSAILYGPSVGSHLDAYARLAAAGAARSVHDGAALGAAVAQLIAPDRASVMALAGWEAVTEGAQVTDRLIELVQDTLDLGRVPDARA